MRILFFKIILLDLLMLAYSVEPHCSKYDFEEKVLEKMVRVEFKMERMKSEMEQTVKNVDTKLKELQEFLKDQIVTPTLAFKARLNDHTAAPKGQVIVFPIVLLNEGDGYRRQTGTFTATTNGTYLFTTDICVHNSKYLYVDIMVDGVSYTKKYIHDNDNVDCHTADAVAVLKAGQSVWVQSSGGSSGNIIYHTTSIWTTFSGVLLD